MSSAPKPSQYGTHSAFPFLGRRVLVAFLAIVFGPILTNVIFSFSFAIFTAFYRFPAQEDPFSMSILLMGVLFLPSIYLGVPLAFAVSMLVLILGAKARRTPLWLPLVTTALVIFLYDMKFSYMPLSGYGETVLRKSTQGDLPHGPFTILFGFPALLSAAILWRITKNWHSPESTP